MNHKKNLFFDGIMMLIGILLMVVPTNNDGFRFALLVFGAVFAFLSFGQMITHVKRVIEDKKE